MTLIREINDENIWLGKLHSLQAILVHNFGEVPIAPNLA